MSLAAGTLLGSYRVSALLGAGGMGEVYRAQDPRLGRDVAVKVLPEQLFEGEESRQRFEREARLLASLNHPNIAAIYSFEEIPASSGIASRHILVMELLEGDPLRARLAGGALPREVALDWALQAARGLSAAHEKSIVHRDLKPENLFVTKDGFVKILDFGLAKQQLVPAPKEETSAPTATVSPGHRASVTEPGVVLGTLDYMSPEQVRGRPVDHRSDIFSLGTVLHEMLTGARAFHGDSVADTMAAITRDEPTSAPDLAAATDLDLVARRCLAKKPEDRYQTAKELAADLARIAASGAVPAQPSAAAHSSTGFARAPRRRLLAYAGAALAIGAVVAGTAYVVTRRARSPAADERTRIAVLPFENLGAPDQDYFADGVTDEVRGKLTSLASLAVIARGSSTPYKKTAKTPREIAAELDVRYLLAGTIRWEKAGGGGRVQVTPELVEVKKEGAPESRWQQRYQVELTDVFNVQADIASRVAGELGVVLARKDEKKLAERPTANLDAYDAYLKGEEAFGSGTIQDPPRLLRAIAHYEKAVALDPAFVLAWAALSRANSIFYGNATAKPEMAAAAKAAAERAIALAPDRAAGYAAMSLYERNIRNDNTKALEWSQKAQQVEPTALRALAVSASLNMTAGRWDEAIAEMREALRVDPLSVRSHRVLGLAYVRRKRHPEARVVYDRAIALAPTNLVFLEERAMIELASGDLAAARAVLRRADGKIAPEAFVASIANFYDLAWVLDKDQREMLLRLTPAEFGGDKAIWSTVLAQAHLLDGNAERSRAAAQEAAAEFRRQLAGAPNRGPLHASLGFALALAGDKAAAIAEGVRATELVPAENLQDGPYVRHALARIYTLTGEPDKAVDLFEKLLGMPYYLTKAWLRIDPTLEPLRSNPKFQKLVAGA
ncbi:MAG: protein kinase [Acidobacteriota bacterium]|nr:protein kinase [Acidobacteriota bacterium]